MNHEILTLKRMQQFTNYLFDRRDQAKKAALILKAILKAHSPRLSAIAQAMPGSPGANYRN